MKAPKPPQQTTLYFAVLDGTDPVHWTPYGKPFSDVVDQASRSVQPNHVPPKLRQLFRVEVKPLLIGPDQLMEEKNLDKVVGVIIDAQPNGANASAFFEDKIYRLKELYLKQLQDCEKPMFERFGYTVWFVTDRTDRPETANFVDRVRDALGARIKSAAVRYDYIVEEGILAHLMTYVVHEAYFTLARGPK